MKLWCSVSILSILIVFGSQLVMAQDRFTLIEDKLDKLDSDVPGLKETVDFSVAGVSIQEFLRGIAETHNLNVSIDPALSIRITNNFTNEKVKQVFIFLCREYDLDIVFVGSIMSFKKYIPPTEVAVAAPPKEIVVTYNSYGESVSWDFRKDTLDRVVKKITQLTKKNVLVGTGLENKTVSGYVENMPFENALEKMAYTNQLKYTKTKDNFFILEKLEQEVQTASGNGGSNYNNNNGFSTKANNGNLQIEIVNSQDSLRKLINLDAVNVPITDVIKAVSREYKANFFMFAEPKGNATTRVTGVTYEELLSYLMQGTDYTYKNLNGIYTIGDRIQEGLRAHKVIQLKHRSAETILEHIPAELKKGVDIKHFKELNGLICSGSEPRINEIEQLVLQLDKVVPMILIEAMIVNVSKTKTIKTGISAGISDSTVTTKGTLLSGLDMNVSSGTINNILNLVELNNVFNLGKVTPNFYMSISALESQGNVQVQATPKLSTLNSHEASLKIGQTRYYELATQNTIGSLTPSVTRTVQYNSIQADLSLKINPTVSIDDQVTLEIEVSNSDFTDLPASGPPPTATSSFKSIIRVRNEDMIVLGGLEKFQKTENGSGIPFLSRIPVIKWLFSSRTRTKTKSRQIVFIKPTIIY